MISSKILERLDLSDDFWDQFNVQNKKLKKQVGLFETESINTPNIITISINPEEYYEEFDDQSNNKKHKGIKKVHQEWTSALTVRKNRVNKIQFGQLNDKRFYFPNGIVSLPFGHFL